MKPFIRGHISNTPPYQSVIKLGLHQSICMRPHLKYTSISSGFTVITKGYHRCLHKGKSHWFRKRTVKINANDDELPPWQSIVDRWVASSVVRTIFYYYYYYCDYYLTL